jgi:hypothetical protein
VSEARAKLSWQAFEFLLERANIEEQGLPRRLTFKGQHGGARLRSRYHFGCIGD